MAIAATIAVAAVSFAVLAKIVFVVVVPHTEIQEQQGSVLLYATTTTTPISIRCDSSRAMTTTMMIFAHLVL